MLADGGERRIIGQELIPWETHMSQMHAGEAILFYECRYYPFSNFSSFAVEWRGRLWMTSEHAYQAAKFLDPEIQERIANARSAHMAKVIAHQHRDDVRPDWEEATKRMVMKEICRAKLRQHTFIQRRLRESGSRELIDNSPKDQFWGWGYNRMGQNELGKIWMELREELVTTGRV